jgi:hypothetical protein
MKQNSGCRARTVWIARLQKEPSAGGTPPFGRARGPQVFSKTSGRTSIAMSQRTPSQRRAILASSTIMASRQAG